MTATAILDFWNREILLVIVVQSWRRISTPNFVKIGQLAAKILRFFNFSRWRPSPSWIIEIVNFYLLTVFGGLSRITVPNIVEISRFFAEILRFFEFSRCPPPPSWIFEIAKFYWLPGSRVETHQRAKFCQNRSIRCEDIKIFQFFKMAAVRHLGFVWGIFGQPTVSTWGLYPSAKFGYDRLSSCYNMNISIFGPFGWNIPVHATKVGFLGNLIP